MTQTADTKCLNKRKIAKYIYHHDGASKQEIAQELGLSMPTVLQRVKELIGEGVVTESGEYESTGGRKAKALSIAAGKCFSVGMDITGNHVSLVLLDAGGRLRAKRRVRKSFCDSEAYSGELGALLREFLKKNRIREESLLGVGISIPGIVDEERGRMTRSHVLELEDYDLGRLCTHIPWPVRFRNDASSAAYAELRESGQDTVYLSLSDTVGGAIYLNGRIYKGEHFRSAEFGHMILVPGGKPCYCGKKGCFDSYCSARVLKKWSGDDLESFFLGLQDGNPVFKAAWNEYLKYLAVGISNLRMAFDCSVVLGGYVGGFMEAWMGELENELSQYRIFKNDRSFVRTGRYKREAAAVGAGIRFVEEFFDSLY